MSQTLTRRSLVATTSATVVAASLPALVAGAHADAALLALRAPYERTLAAAEGLSPAHSRAENAVQAIMRDQPGRDRAEVEREVGLDVAEARWEGALDINGEVIQQIVDMPARTLEGLIFKARVADIDSCNLDLAASIVADLVAMGERNA